MSIKDFCKTAGLRENVSYYWQRKLREATYEQLAEHQTETPVSPFAEVKLLEVREPTALPAADAASQICVEIGDYKITADNSYPTALLAALLRELSKPC